MIEFETSRLFSSATFLTSAFCLLVSRNRPFATVGHVTDNF